MERRIKRDQSEGSAVGWDFDFEPAIARPRASDADVEIIAGDGAGPVGAAAVERERASFPSLL